MDVHDTPSMPRNIEMSSGVVITIEPGIYVKEKNTSVREEFQRIGYRIEDNILLTQTGIDVLTEEAIRETRNIEFLLNGTY